jgi:hypothetical protein
VGVDSSADRHTAHRPGHFTRHEPGTDSEGTAGSDGSEPLAVGVSGPRGYCWATGVDHYIRVCHPALGVPELPAVGGGLLARGFRGVHCQRRGSSSGRRASVGRLRIITRAGQLGGFPLSLGRADGR